MHACAPAPPADQDLQRQAGQAGAGAGDQHGSRVRVCVGATPLHRHRGRDLQVRAARARARVCCLRVPASAQARILRARARVRVRVPLDWVAITRRARLWVLACVLARRFMPDPSEVAAALDLYRAAGVPAAGFTGVPLFQVRAWVWSGHASVRAWILHMCVRGACACLCALRACVRAHAGAAPGWGAWEDRRWLATPRSWPVRGAGAACQGYRPLLANLPACPPPG